MSKRITLNETSYFGPGSIQVLADELKNHNIQRVLVVTDPDIVKAKIVMKITKILATSKIVYLVFDKIRANPSIHNVRSCVDTATLFRADCLIAVGGGSVLDTAKAASVVLTNPEFKDVRKLEGLSKTKNKGLPLIALPTTCGSGSEATSTYVITDEDRQRKFTCIDAHSIPMLSIVDSELSAKMPSELCATTGMDALAHAVEAYVTKDSWQMTDMYCLEAIRLIGSSLRAAGKGNEKAREQMSYAQYIAGMGASNSGLGLVHAMAHPLSAVFDVPHGLACAVLLAPVMASNAASTGEKYREIAVAMGAKVSSKATPAVYRKAAVTSIEKLVKEIGIGKKLKLTVQKKDLELLAETALKDVCLSGNPKEVTKKKIIDIYKSVL